MTIQTAIQSTASGDNTIGHVVTAATLGDGLAAILVWGLQSAHLAPPASVAQGITAVCMVIASYAMQKLSN